MKDECRERDAMVTPSMVRRWLHEELDAWHEACPPDLPGVTAEMDRETKGRVILHLAVPVWMPPTPKGGA